MRLNYNVHNTPKTIKLGLVVFQDITNSSVTIIEPITNIVLFRKVSLSYYDAYILMRDNLHSLIRSLNYNIECTFVREHRYIDFFVGSNIKNIRKLPNNTGMFNFFNYFR